MWQQADERAALAREEAIAWARHWLARDDWVVLDSETTGLDGAAELVEVAVIAGDGRVLLETLVKPQGAIPPATTRIHGITAADVADAPPFPLVWPALRDVLAGRTALIYHADFDCRLLRQTAARYGLVVPPLTVECLMHAYAKFWGQPGGRGGFRWQKLAEACPRHGIPAGRHRARDDCQAALGLLRVMAAGGAPSAGGEEAALARLAARWPAIRREVTICRPQVGAVLAAAAPRSIVAGVLTLATAYPFHRQALSEPAARLLIEAVVSRHLGRPVRVVCAD